MYLPMPSDADATISSKCLIIDFFLPATDFLACSLTTIFRNAHLCLQIQVQSPHGQLESTNRIIHSTLTVFNARSTAQPLCQRPLLSRSLLAKDQSLRTDLLWATCLDTAKMDQVASLNGCNLKNPPSRPGFFRDQLPAS